MSRALLTPSFVSCTNLFKKWQTLQSLKWNPIIVEVQLLSTGSETSTVQFHWLKKCFFLLTRICFICLSGCFVCFQMKKKTDRQIPLSSNRLCPLWGSLLLSFSLTAQPLFPLRIFQREAQGLRGKCTLPCDPSMLMIISITLYGIPLVVIKRHITFERLEPNQSLSKATR